MIDRHEIERLLPHRGAMVMLDRVVFTDAASIQCVTRAHREPANPLARNGRLSCLAAIEFGAQAMALHAALRAGDGWQIDGRLALIRNMKIHRDRLDDREGWLAVDATLDAASGSLRRYRFRVAADAVPLVEGEATVVQLGRVSR